MKKKGIVWETKDEFGNRAIFTKSCLRSHIYVGGHPWESTFVSLTKETVEKSDYTTKDETGIHYHLELTPEIKELLGFERFNYHWVCSKLDKGGRYRYVATFKAVEKLQDIPRIIGGRKK